jgi:hypothetical protein
MVRVSTPSFAKFVTAAMPQHVRVNLRVEAGSLRSPFDQCLEAPNRKRRPTLANEYKRRFGFLLALEPA